MGKARRACTGAAVVCALVLAGSLASSTAALAGSPQPRAVAGGVERANRTTTVARLLGVAGASSTNGWAVGDVSTDGVSSSLVEHWDGISWQQVASPSPGGAFGTTLTGVTVVSATNVWAVGSYGSLLTGPRTLVLHWNGARWSQVASPSPSASGSNLLTGVSAAAGNDIWAVGSYSSTSITSVTLTEHWNGSQWTVVPSPNPSHRVSNTLSAVTAISGNDVWAVGSFAPSATSEATLVAHWNGKRWSRPSSPSPGALDNELLSVTASSTKDVWAVGDSSDQPGVTAGVIEHWNGRKWVLVAGPDLGGAQNGLSAVSAFSKKDAWAVGSVLAGNVQQTLTMHWDGQAWTVVPSPDPGAFGCTLHGVLAGGPDGAWAVGSANTSAVEASPLIEGWDGQEWNVY